MHPTKPFPSGFEQQVQMFWKRARLFRRHQKRLPLTSQNRAVSELWNRDDLQRSSQASRSWRPHVNKPPPQTTIAYSVRASLKPRHLRSLCLEPASPYVGATRSLAASWKECRLVRVPSSLDPGKKAKSLSVWRLCPHVARIFLALPLIFL